MSELSFAQLLEESLTKTPRLDEVVKGTVVKIQKGLVIIDTGFKSESPVDISEFTNAQGELEVQVGDEVDVILKAVEDGSGETLVSRIDAKHNQSWQELEEAFKNDSIIHGFVSGKVKGGFTIEINGVRAFLPGSLVDLRPVRNELNLEGQTLELKVVKIDQKRNNVVVSRKAVIEVNNSAERDEVLATLTEGAVVKGKVKNLTEYGAFIDLGSVDGLLHITDMMWKRVKHPSEVVSVDQEITVKVLKFDKEKIRVSLGLKQLTQDPWNAIIEKYSVNSKLVGKVTNLTDYGCFVEVLDGVEGLVHVSEMDWTNKNIHPSKVVSVGDQVEVMILEIDEENRRISLGLKQCQTNPWKHFAETHNKNDKVKGVIKSITDFGLFIGLEGGIDGLVHISDISWDIQGEEAVQQYKKGEEIEALVLQVDVVKERISLGIKQLQNDPFINFVNETKKGSFLTGKVVEVDAKGVTVEINEAVKGYIKASEATLDRVEDITAEIKVGDEIEAKYVSTNRKSRMLNLSVRAKEEAEKSEAISKVNKEELVIPNAFSEAFKVAKGE